MPRKRHDCRTEREYRAASLQRNAHRVKFRILGTEGLLDRRLVAFRTIFLGIPPAPVQFVGQDELSFLLLSFLSFRSGESGALGGGHLQE